MINKILIANRSEIACRIIRACKELGIKTVAVYSEIDAKAKHVIEADQAYCIGAAPATESYLNIDALLDAAKQSNADAIHPGYGFLAENSEFIQRVEQAGLIFIGPNAEAVELLGSKIESRKLVIDADVPLIPGMKSSSKDMNKYLEAAENIGFPVLIKASAGGGGKGMRVVEDPKDLITSVEAAQREALKAFASDEVYLEKYIEAPRHVEIQVAADKHGNMVHFFERECSIQRRHQKIIEESPSTALDQDLRMKMGEAALRVIKAAKYDSVGTVEFLLDKDKNFYFLEVNTRIQVEHPISEEVTGVDLVKLQINIADGKEIPYRQEKLSQRGHAIECRIYAEDAENNFLPSSGKLLYLKEPGGTGVRFDSGVLQGAEVSVYYDPVLAKLITWGKDREEARERMLLALRETILLGVKTSISFMIEVLEHNDFINGDTFTDFIAINFPDFKNDEKYLDKAFAAAALAKSNGNAEVYIENKKPVDPWQTITSWEI